MFKVNAIQCLKCRDVIFSRARHDYRSCSCGKTAIDGGFDYTRLIGSYSEPVKLALIVTKKQLYDDWNNRTDKYGKIEMKEITNKLNNAKIKKVKRTSRKRIG